MRMTVPADSYLSRSINSLDPNIMEQEYDAILNNLNLENIDDGEYELCAFPIKLGGLEAAPCRAILLEMEKGLN